MGRCPKPYLVFQTPSQLSTLTCRFGSFDWHHISGARSAVSLTHYVAGHSVCCLSSERHVYLVWCVVTPVRTLS